MNANTYEILSDFKINIKNKIKNKYILKKSRYFPRQTKTEIMNLKIYIKCNHKILREPYILIISAKILSTF